MVLVDVLTSLKGAHELENLELRASNFRFLHEVLQTVRRRRGPDIETEKAMASLLEHFAQRRGGTIEAVKDLLCLAAPACDKESEEYKTITTFDQSIYGEAEKNLDIDG